VACGNSAFSIDLTPSHSRAMTPLPARFTLKPD
jgi:hypothetical protein